METINEFHWNQIKEPFSPEIMAEIAIEEENIFQEEKVSFPEFITGDTLLYLQSHEHARQYQNFLDENKRKIERWNNKYKVPRGLNKKELNKLLKDTQKEIDFWLDKTRDPNLNQISKEFCDRIREEWKGKKIAIQSTLKFHEGFGTEQSLAKAKQYPIDNLIKFEGTFAKCIWHEEKSGSMKYYKSQNVIHCFGCDKDGDSIDVAQQLFNLTWSEAIKKLTT